MTAEKFVHRLMIQTVRMSDAGEYSVVAGSSVSKAQLIVEGRDVRIAEPAEREIMVGCSEVQVLFYSISVLPSCICILLK